MIYLIEPVTICVKSVTKVHPGDSVFDLVLVWGVVVLDPRPLEAAVGAGGAEALTLKSLVLRTLPERLVFVATVVVENVVLENKRGLFFLVGDEGEL